MPQKPAYPVTRKGDVVETLHGVQVADPYRWLEDANSDETKAWVDAQNKVTFAYLESIPERAAIRARIEKLINYERFGSPAKRGKHYFYTRNSGLQNQSVLYVTESLDKEGRVLLDPNELSKDGTVALSGTSFSWDGRYLAYSLSQGGSDWQEWRVRDVETGKDLPDVVKWSKFSGASWTKDNKGFYYSKYDEPKEGQALAGVNEKQKVMYHRLGTTEDGIAYERPDEPKWGFGTETTEDGRYLVLSVWKDSSMNNLMVKDLRDRGLVAREIIGGFDGTSEFLGNDGSTFYVVTDKGAPNRRIVAIDITKPEMANWRTIVPEGKENIESASLLGDTFYVQSLRDATTRVSRVTKDGKSLGDISLPGLGTASGFGGLRNDKETFYVYTSFVSPPTIFRYDLKSAKSEVWKTAKMAADLSQYETKQVFYPSKDGTRVPMFIIAKKGLERNGENPTLLYGYGGFQSSMTPYFSVSVINWLEMGGVYAVANLRGGNEYGQAWYDGGRLKNKQNVFDDFIAAGEYLIREKITSTPKLAINGGSNGGLLVGAVLNQRPDLFGAAVPQVGVMDMLRFHKFTIGWAWKGDYGDPDKPEDFAVVYKYSPLHNIKPGTKYPATLITTGDHDDRVVPAHSFKYAATLQAAQAGDAPTLIRIETSAGHGAGKPISKTIDELADMYAFLWQNLEMGK